jgi:hypothetical protein
MALPDFRSRTRSSSAVSAVVFPSYTPWLTSGATTRVATTSPPPSAWCSAWLRSPWALMIAAVAPMAISAETRTTA